MYLYETHLHTSPVSRCARATVRESLTFYKEQGYAGVFITNHYIGAGGLENASYEDRIRYYCSDYEQGKAMGEEIGLPVFFGVETSVGGTDFLIYGLDKAWFLAHPEIETMTKSAELELMRQEGALIVQAHPFREASYIDHIRLFPRHVHGVEVVNACRTSFENEMARQYAENYGLLPFAGSDNHSAPKQRQLAGMKTDRPIADEADFVKRVLDGGMTVFTRTLPPIA